VLVSLLQLPLAITFANPISSLYLFVTSPRNATAVHTQISWSALEETDAFYSWVITVHGIGILLSAFIVMWLPFLTIFKAFMATSLMVPIVSGVLYANSSYGWVVMIAHFLMGAAYGVLEVMLVSYISVAASKIDGGAKSEKKNIFSTKDMYLAATLILRTVGWPIGLGMYIVIPLLLTYALLLFYYSGISSLMAQFPGTVDQFRWPGWANATIIIIYALAFMFMFRSQDTLPNIEFSKLRETKIVQKTKICISNIKPRKVLGSIYIHLAPM